MFVVSYASIGYSQDICKPLNHTQNKNTSSDVSDALSIFLGSLVGKSNNVHWGKKITAISDTLDLLIKAGCYITEETETPKDLFICRINDDKTNQVVAFFPVYKDEEIKYRRDNGGRSRCREKTEDLNGINNIRHNYNFNYVGCVSNEGFIYSGDMNNDAAFPDCP
jgi:hypothetical protein